MKIDIPQTVYKRIGLGLVIVNAVLALTHFLMPEMSWGQGRSSYFYIQNQLSLSSWLISMEFLILGIISLLLFHTTQSRRGTWFWSSIASLLISLGEMTRIHIRMDIPGFVQQSPFDSILFISVLLFCIYKWAGTLHPYMKSDENSRQAFYWWIITWTVAVLVTAWMQVAEISNTHYIDLIRGLLYMMGTSMLLMVYLSFLRRQQPQHIEMESFVFPDEKNRVFTTFAGIGIISFIFLFLELLLFRYISIHTDYLTANTIIALALLGGAIGGVVGFWRYKQNPEQSIVQHAMGLPFLILISMGAVFHMNDYPFWISIILMLPFVSINTIVSILLIRYRTHVAYFATLIGGGLGTLIVHPSLMIFREESSMILLSALAILTAAVFYYSFTTKQIRIHRLILPVFSLVILISIGVLNAKIDFLNIVLEDKRARYPEGEILYSRSSYISRYDVMRRHPGSSVLKTIENGYTIDTMRDWDESNYQIDPRLPNNLFDNPSVLIIGISGDGISKTAKAISTDIVGLEINPAIASLQANELAKYNGYSYNGIDIQIMDGRTYVEASERKFNMITLLNTHFARGSTRNRVVSPEYLFTLEAFENYFDDLTEDGLVVIEEPVQGLDKELAVLKMVETIRQSLVNRGSTQPENHIYVFQWKTRSNNYYQVLAAKSPMDNLRVRKIQSWLHDVNIIRELEKEAGRELGPITSDIYNLQVPGEILNTNIANAARGTLSREFKKEFNIKPISDDYPYLYDIDPERPAVKSMYNRMLILTGLFIPFALFSLRRAGKEIPRLHSPMIGVILSGLGFLLLEILLIQKFELILGAPVITYSAVLGTLLVASGAGSYMNEKMNRSFIKYVPLLIAVYCLILILLLPLITQWIIHFPIPIKTLLVILLIIPLGYAMGMPFPFFLNHVKQKQSASAVAVLYAVNASASALAVPLAFSYTTSSGFQIAYLVGVIHYALIWPVIMETESQKRKRPFVWGITTIIIAVVVSPWFQHTAFVQKDNDHPIVYALKYGESRYGYHRAVDGGNDHSIVYGWYFWVIQTKDKTILVDIGFNEDDESEDWSFDEYTRPLDKLLSLHINGSMVTDVILTHSHWDHAGAVDDFPHANFWIQKKEWEWMSDRFSERTDSRNGLEYADYQALNTLMEKGQLKLVDGDMKMLDNIHLYHAGGHTPGSQFVTVETKDGTIILGGDNVNLFTNILRMKAGGNARNKAENIAALERMRMMGASPFLVVPGHDPETIRQFSRVDRDVVKIGYK